MRDLYDLRHTYATFALRAGVPVFAVSRFIGSSIAMIDHHYGHLAHDSREHAVSLLDALALERAVDAAWTFDPTGPEACHGQRFKAEAEGIQHSGGRSVDVAARTRRHPSLRKGLICRENAKPSDGLEPSTPSLPWRCSTN